MFQKISHTFGVGVADPPPPGVESPDFGRPSNSPQPWFRWPLPPPLGGMSSRLSWGEPPRPYRTLIQREHVLLGLYKRVKTQPQSLRLVVSLSLFSSAGSHFQDQIAIWSKFAKCSLAPRSSLESRHKPTGGRWFTVQISRGPKIKVGSRDLGL